MIRACIESQKQISHYLKKWFSSYPDNDVSFSVMRELLVKNTNNGREHTNNGWQNTNNGGTMTDKADHGSQNILYTTVLTSRFGTESQVLRIKPDTLLGKIFLY